MSKQTRSKIPKGVTKVNIPATGESMISMGENVGWIKGPYDAVKAVQKLIIDGEEYRKEIRELKGELLICENALSNALDKLQGTRQHRTEVKIDG